ESSDLEEEAALKGQQQVVPLVRTVVDEPLGHGYGALRRRMQLKLHRSILRDHTQRLDALPPTLFKGYDRDLRELYTVSREARDKFFSQHYRLKFLEHEQERATVTFGALWRPVLALEAWARCVDTRRTKMSHARYDDHRLIHDMLVHHTVMQHEL
nr:hypothetical protein [Tanacetum cinerariifolium]